jgi:hypothetical protein
MLRASKPRPVVPAENLLLLCYAPSVLHLSSIMSTQGEDNASQQMTDLLGKVAIDDRPYFHWAYDDADSGADLVIQTMDGVNFRVHSYYLKANRFVSLCLLEPLC